MIVKRKDGFYVVSEKGKNLGGPYGSRKRAQKRLAQVEAFKHMNKAMNYVIVGGYPEPYLERWSVADITVWIVNGKWVRENRDIDFTQGGNHGKYPWIPGNEIWIDSGLEEVESMPTLLHELIEYRYMIVGYDYDLAHDVASNIELSYRNEASDLILGKVEDTAIEISNILKNMRNSE